MPIREYLRHRAAALEAVVDFDTLAVWHDDFAKTWTPQAALLAGSANAVLGLAGVHAVRDELGYLVAERQVAQTPRKHRLVILSANPGWSETTNSRERILKGQPPHDGCADLVAYASFRRKFFPRWYEEVMKPQGPSRAAWWNRALNFLHRIAALPKPPEMTAIHDDLDVLGWELWPFHSTRDGLSDAAGVGSELDAFATASIRAACRFASDGVIIASKAGADRALRMVGTEFELTDEFNFANAPYAARLSHKTTGRRVVVIRRQLFAGFSPSRSVLQALAAFARGEPTPIGNVGTRPVQPHVAAQTAPSIYSIPEEGPIRVVKDIGSGTLLVVVHVCGRGDGKDLPPLREDADEEEVHTRVGGYWVTSRNGGRAAKVQAALAQDRQVLVVGLYKGVIVRVLEVGCSEDFPMPQQFQHADGRTFLHWAYQPRWVAHPKHSERRFATAYHEVNQPGTVENRVRYHTHPFEDEGWTGRRLEAPGHKVPQTPPLYSLAQPVE